MWVFFADVHLDTGQDARRAEFLAFLDSLEAARAAGKRIDLVCLGDLVEFWLEGDSYDLRGRTPEIERLRPFAPLFIPGNRDFLAGPRFAEATGATILPDEWLLEAGGMRLALLHGDRLCRDDIRYRIWRAASRRVSGLFRGIPQGAAEFAAKKMREISSGEVKRKGARAHAIDCASVRERLAKGADACVAGHTHRPEVRSFTEGSLFILGCWGRKDAKAEILVADEGGRTYFGPWPSALASAGCP